MPYFVRFLILPIIVALGVLTTASGEANAAQAKPAASSDSSSDQNVLGDALESLLGNSYDGGVLNAAAGAITGLENGLEPQEATETDNVNAQ